MSELSRREFVKRSVVASAVLSMPSMLIAQGVPNEPVDAPKPAAPAGIQEGHEVVLRWLDGKAPAALAGVTWGVPWPRGMYKKDQTFKIATDTNQPVAAQSWPIATWPDGSLKWSAHAVGPDAIGAEANSLTLAPGDAPEPASPLTLKEAGDVITVDTGVVVCQLSRTGDKLISTISRDGKPILQNGHLILLRQDSDGRGDDVVEKPEKFTGSIDKVTIEQSGPVRAVIKFEGKHKGPGDRAWLPFVVRLYFHAGSEAVRVMHTIVYDGDEKKDFIRGLGLRFEVAMRGELYDRHVRFANENGGLFAEAVRGLTGLRRDPGAEVKRKQVAGELCPPISQFAASVRNNIDYIPAFGDYSLAQTSADSFAIRKRTKAGYTWLKSGIGRRAPGLGYVGTPAGGAAFGIRNFWQSHPAQLDVRNAASEAAEVTLWLWAPDAPAMDMRFYHDGMGQDTYEKQLRGLEITYEDYEPGFESAVGVARTSEMFVWTLPATPPRARYADLAGVVASPPVVVCAPEHYHAAGVFGQGLWNLVDRSSPAKAKIEDQLDWNFAFYTKQRDQHGWYGFWDYGDVMHSYDGDRHVWKYDIGGCAWDNSELSTDLWLWYAFLRSGRSDVFHFAEAMTRHTGEVDVHHIGKFRGLGSRHNVIHWGCSAKQLRISTAVNRRMYYYLTADERVGDLMHELLDADLTLITVPANRKVGGRKPGEAREQPATLGFGTEWCSLAGAWLTEWERTGDTKWRDKIANGMKSIGQAKRGWFAGGGDYDPKTGMIYPPDRIGVSHLSAAFGAPEISAEMIELIGLPEYEKAWLQYCELYNATRQEQEKALGQPLGRLNLAQGHSRLTAYAGYRRKDAALSKRAWQEFYGGEGGARERTNAMRTTRVEGPASLNPVDENAWVGTNGTAQWGLAAIQCLALAGDAIPES